MDNLQQKQPTTFEQLLGQQLFQQRTAEKTYTDKLLSRQDISHIQILVRKEDLTRSELLDLLYMLSSSEIKLANFNDWDRYLLGKFLAWIRDFVSICEILYDYKEKYEPGEKKKSDSKEKENPDEPKAELDEEFTDIQDIAKLMENCRKFMLHNIKFLVDIFLYLSRSTLSLSMSAFEILSTSRYEYAYPGMENLVPQPKEEKSPFRVFMRS
jgi:hypothetical protein